MTILGIKFELKPISIIILSTLLFTYDHYHPITTSKAADRLILYFLIPLAFILLILRQNPADYGLQLGNWRKGIKWSLLCMALTAPILWYLGHTPDFRHYYGGGRVDAVGLTLETIGQLLGWEFILRGFLLFGLAGIAGPHAIFIQAVPFALLHLGKPEAETWTTVFGGAVLGLVAWDSRSFLYPFLIHCFLYVSTILIASGALG